MKTMKILGCGFLALSLLTSCSSKETTEVNPEPSVETLDKSEIALTFVETLINQDYSALATDFTYDSEMEKVKDNFESLFKSSFEQLGDLIELQASSELSQGEYTIIRFPVLFEAQNLCINVVFNGDNQIAGINMSEYIAPSEGGGFDFA